MPNTLPLRVRLAGYEFSLKTGELSGGGQTVRLAEKPFRVLLILVEGGGELVTREEIQRKLWPGDTVVDFEHGINTAIKVLRRALGDSAEDPKYIETIPRRGYRLMVPVERVDSAAGDTSGTGLGSSSDGGTGIVRLQPEPGGLTGKTVSHYRVLEVVGGGGMGVVYRAEDLKLGRAVALKFLPEEVGNDPRALERFEREARAASSLDHPNICSIYEFGEHEGRPFIVMQLLQGQTLRDCLATVQNPVTGTYSGQPLPIDVLLEEALQILDGLEAAHEKGIIHRDIKPANIFITTKGVTKILDFGLAKLLRGSGSTSTNGELSSERQAAMASGAVDLSRVGVALGTAAYMSPEQVRGEKLDTRTDLFSFGLVLYEMATGQRAFSTENATILPQAILNSIPIPVHDLNPSLPPRLEEIVNKCLEKDRNLRYQNAPELREDLKRLKGDVAEYSSAPEFGATASPLSAQHGRSAAANHDSVLKPSTRWSKKLVGSALIVGLLILIAGAYGAYTLWRARVVPPFQNMKIERLTNSGKVRVGAISPDGRYVLYAHDEGNGQQSLRLRHMATGSDTQIVAPGTLTYLQLNFSPDSDFLYFIALKPEDPTVGVLYRIPVLGGQPRKLIEDVDRGVSFSPDGKEIVFVRDNPSPATSRVMVANADGTGERVLASLVGQQYVGVAWSPDGKWIAAITASGTGRASDAILLNPQNGAAKTIYSGQSISLFSLAWTGDNRHLVASFTEPSMDQLQIGEISISDGRLRRITNDLSDYGGLSLTKDGKQLAATQTVIDRGLYIMSAAPDDASNPPAIDDRIYEAYWLPDGRLLVVDNSYRVITMSADGSNQTVIFQDKFVVGRFSVCPDGRHALFSALDKKTGNLNIGRLDIQSSDTTMLTSDQFDVTPACSPDGTYFLYSSRVDRKWRVMKKPLAGGPATPLSEKPAVFPAISPDGSQIAAVALEGSGTNYVEMIKIFSPQGGPSLKSFSPGPTFLPQGDSFGLQFSADGHAIYYLTRNKGVDNIVMQPMAGGPPVPVTNFRDKFITAFDFDWKNKRLAVVRGTSRSDLVLITQQESH